MILLDKNLDLIMEETLAELEGMGIKDPPPGSVARIILTAINKQLDQYYKTLNINHAQAFVSKAKDRFLELIGELLDCHRLESERNDDEAYRYRITKQIQIVASSNYTAVRLAALSVDGVQDVVMKRFTHGTGSFSVYVVTEEPDTPQDVLDAVQEAINETQAFGIRGEVFKPVIRTVQIKARIVFNKKVTDLDRRLATAQAFDELKRYVNSRTVGEPLVINDIQSLIHTIHNQIEEVIIFDYKIDNRPVLAVDQVCAWNERFIESSLIGAIKVL